MNHKLKKRMQEGPKIQKQLEMFDRAVQALIDLKKAKPQ
jgi:hypothetical protein